MKLLLATSALVLVALGAAHAEIRPVSGFTGVSAADRIRVEVVLGDNYRVEVLGSDADKVATRLDDETLVIRRRTRPLLGGAPPIDANVRVTMPVLESLSASRGAELTAVNVNTGHVSLAAAMGGELRITGTCTDLDATASMGGAIRAERLECSDANLAASMGGDARVFVANRYDATASMGGSISVVGGGRSGDVSTSMGGSVEGR